MPAQFDSFGVRFLYPDNWTIAPREPEEGDQGMTLDIPGGGFMAIESTRAGAVEELIEGIVRTIAADYEEVEREQIQLPVLPAETAVTDVRFYYLDLLIVSRIVILPRPQRSEDDEVLMIQIQAESRDFDKNEPVFAAILKQIADAV
ncbi:hypothetical protein NHH03_27570 [Stieleria sp. TO1_6]|uniref:hypothetical protein n=1 Tax=Stieleria tagensis TaxID=2956795 RepID=UPI00209BB24E|nr:hypothetical protein [Stieleria tagensis]MCO8125529.1 hypothetical protein [Stieleria tagensis]